MSIYTGLEDTYYYSVNASSICCQGWTRLFIKITEEVRRKHGMLLARM